MQEKQGHKMLSSKWQLGNIITISFAVNAFCILTILKKNIKKLLFLLLQKVLTLNTVIAFKIDYHCPLKPFTHAVELV